MKPVLERICESKMIVRQAKNSGYDIKTIRVKFPDESDYGELYKSSVKLADVKPKL